jgi:hypothetical protein
MSFLRVITYSFIQFDLIVLFLVVNGLQTTIHLGAMRTSSIIGR